MKRPTAISGGKTAGFVVVDGACALSDDGTTAKAMAITSQNAVSAWRNSSLDYDLRRGAPGIHAAPDLFENFGGDLAINFGVRAVRLGGHHRQAGIRFLPDGHVQRHFTEERHTLALGFLARTAVAEDIRARSAFWAQEITHVLNDAQHRHVDASE